MSFSRTAWVALPVSVRVVLSVLIFATAFATSTAEGQQRRDSTEMPMQHSMTMQGPLGISMDRMGSGTTWIPDAVTLPSRQTMAGPWNIMLHGFAFFQYNKQGGPRGDSQFGSLNWGMVMASRDVAAGRFQVRTMLSFDPLTVTARGYPLLLQTGESYGGQPLYDRQHPHDFWMELGALYERPVSANLGVSLYAGPSGEPALGPVAFMHRPSAMDNLLAPLSHHWADATHISFGVVTAGVFGRKWKLEGSVFNGREPDEKRWGFDRLRLDSYSARLTVNPDSGWSATLGYGFLKSPEGLKPSESMRRVVGSVLYGRKLGTDGQWATALIWGANAHSGHDGLAHAALFESEAILDRSNTLLARAELVQKTAEELVLPAGGGLSPEQKFNVGTMSLGFIREIGRASAFTAGIGVLGTLNVLPRTLSQYYGGRTPLGGAVFIRIRPFHGPAMSMEGMVH